MSVTSLLVEPIPAELQERLLSEPEALDMVGYDKENPDPHTGKPRTTTYLGVPILQEHSIRVMARKIIKHNQRHQFTSVSNIGSSGSGKTSSTTNLIHEVHTIAEEEYGLIYTIRWVGRRELLDFDRFLKSLAPVPTILIFEDISYALELVKKIEKVRIKEAFTEIRHTMGEVNVICVFHYHYTRGMDKMMRSTKFTLICSIDHEEKNNLLQIHGYDFKEFFDKLEYRLRGMDENGWCTVAIDPENDKQYVYYYGKPFNIGLSIQNGVFHFFFYANYKTSDKVWCNHCAPFKMGTKLAPKAFIENVVDVYGIRRTMSALKWWCFIKGGKRSIHTSTYQTFKFMNKLFAEHPVDMDEMLDYVEKLRKRDNKNPRQMRKDKSEKLTSDIVYDSVIENKDRNKNKVEGEVLAGFEGMVIPTGKEEKHDETEQVDDFTDETGESDDDENEDETENKNEFFDESNEDPVDNEDQNNMENFE